MRELRTRIASSTDSRARAADQLFGHALYSRTHGQQGLSPRRRSRRSRSSSPRARSRASPKRTSCSTTRSSIRTSSARRDPDRRARLRGQARRPRLGTTGDDRPDDDRGGARGKDRRAPKKEATPICSVAAPKKPRASPPRGFRVRGRARRPLPDRGPTAYAGISLTHRTHASSVAYITATESKAKDRTSHDWSKLATGPETLVIFMGMRKLDSLMALLIEHGRDPTTPAAVVQSASLPTQRTVIADVETIAARAREAELGLPAITIVGRCGAPPPDAALVRSPGAVRQARARHTSDPISPRRSRACSGDAALTRSRSG